MKNLLLTALFITLSIPIYSQNDSIGIYMKNNGVMTKIEPIKAKGSKSNSLGSSLTMGIASTTIRTVFSGAKSFNKANSSTEFYFYFPATHALDAHLLSTYYMFYNAVSPKEFTLARFKQKRSTRELSIGKVNIYAGVEMGVDENSEVSVATYKVRDGLYKVTVFNITPGEYGFISNAPMGAGAYMPIFDFSIE